MKYKNEKTFKKYFRQYIVHGIIISYVFVFQLLTIIKCFEYNINIYITSILGKNKINTIAICVIITTF